MTKKQAKIMALQYVVGCVAERHAGNETDTNVLELSERDREKVDAEVNEICYSIGDRVRKLTGEQR